MSGEVSTTTKTRSFKMAFLLDGDGLRRINGLLEEKVLTTAEPAYNSASKKPDYRVDFSDSSNLATTSVDEVADQPNSRQRRITAITINTAYLNRGLRARITFRPYRSLPAVEYEVSGDTASVLDLADELDQHLEGFRRPYSPILRVNFFLLAAAYFLLFYLYVGTVSAMDVSPDDAASLREVFIAYVIILGPFVVAAVLQWLRNTLFPVATFAIGQGVARDKTLNFWRVVVIAGLSVGVVSSLIATGLISLF